MTDSGGTEPAGTASTETPEERQRRASLLELLDRVVNKGVVISGDLVISVAEVDLIYLGLKVLLSSVESALEMGVVPEAPQRLQH